ncbi:esterase-like activity of phytase family protein [Patulibacter sp. SYSU D01012]|uniref:esterase-like activity of phytase family protein n=1 Tax=Patulibacter sp. SYSU D01012 TaxID=2817381 RepID=UPI001B318079|nr:esterase-like activity of phytase family protein [Patulibacter sp. SYSU D01012]
MRIPRLIPLLAAASALAAPSAAAAHGGPHRPRPPKPAAAPTLVARATLPATTYLPGPASGAALAPTPVNGVTPPFPGQPVPGFSGLLTERDGTILGLPDNGYGAKTNSADFLLAIHRVDADWRTARGGAGALRVRGTIALRDPRRRVPFPLTREDRRLTGADFDVESIQRGPDDTFWIGDEFGPFLLHVDRDGVVLDPPVPLPGVKSPQSPDLAAGETPNLPASGGFEATAALRGGRILLPFTEKALTTDADQTRHLVSAFDTRRGRYTGQTWTYRTERPDTYPADAQALDAHRLLVLERDNLDGPDAQVKRLYVVDLRRTAPDGSLVKRQVADLLDLRNPGVTQELPGTYGLGQPFRFAFVSVESVLPVGGDRVLVANDNNFPNDDGRQPGKADDTEIVAVDVPGLRRVRP